MRNRRLQKLTVAVILAAASTTPARAAEKNCEGSLTVDSGFTVRSWKVETRWGATAVLSPHFTTGQAYNPATVSEAVEEVRQSLLPQLGLDSLGGVSTLAVTSCVEKVSAHEVDVTIQPFLMRIDLVKVGSNILPVPHFNHPAAPASTPSPLSKLNPSIGLTSDRRAGVAEEVQFSTDLLHLASADNSVTPANRLLLNGSGNKSLNEDFYDASLQLAWSHQRATSTLRNVSLTGSFAAQHQPRGDGNYLRNAARFGGQLMLSPNTGVFRKAVLAGTYRWSSNRYFLPRAADLVTENGFEFRGVTDARLFGGMARFAAWLDGGFPSGASSYQRGVAVVGYARDIPAAHSQTFGVEALFGAGHTWGTAPRYARFFGGSQGANFLYEGLDSVQLASVPVGPLLRSYGTAEAGAGASGFWNFNLNVSIPIPKLSRALIPAVDTPFGSLSEVTKSQALTSSRSFLTSFYKKQGSDEAKAKTQVDADLREITPAVKYLADYANLWALKPLVAMDVARLGGITRKAVGGGLQLTIVVARFEACYLRTIGPLAGESRGNFILRLTFENLF